VEDEEEEEEEEEEGGGEETVEEQDISKKIRTYEQSLHCISELTQFAIDSNSSSLLELLYTVKDCIQKDMITKKVKTDFFGSMEEISMSCTLETCNVQRNTALICILIMLLHIVVIIVLF
jgi:hypothetical protein